MDRCYDAGPMDDLARWTRTRIIPALLTAIGVAFLAAGLMSITNPVTADGLASPSPSAEAVVVPTPSPRITLPPLGSGGLATASPTIPVDRVATRVRIAALKIDLPIVRPPDGAYPLCDVAMYYPAAPLGQPGQGRSTYIYAHARTGMFLPMLAASKIANGKKMIGMVVEVWTSDDQRFLYVITEVRRHVPAGDVFIDPFAATTETLWLQTSEGVGPQPKLLLKAEPLSQEAADPADAHPVAKPRVCR